MRKLKLQVQMTIDGFIGGANGEMDWLTFNWDKELTAYVQALTNPVDSIVLGRKLAEGFIPHWAAVAADAEHPEFEAGKKFTTTPKVVFSKTLTHSPWPNTTLATKGLAEEIHDLKATEGGDIIAYGGAQFVRSLIQQNLIDEYHLFINPVAIGKGLAIFNDVAPYQKMVLAKATPFDCGITALHYTAPEK